MAELEAEGQGGAGRGANPVGTPYWMAPEVVEMQSVSTASDIWSVGCLAIELLTGGCGGAGRFGVKAAPAGTMAGGCGERDQAPPCLAGWLAGETVARVFCRGVRTTVRVNGRDC